MSWKKSGSSETIFAVASGSGKAGIAVIRVSGRDAGRVVKELSGGLPEARKAVVRHLKDKQGEHLDKALVLWFPGPASFTGEDVAEFHIHGGRAVMQGVMERIEETKNCRMADPGEFTRRAFYNGKMDLTGIEGLADLLAAQTKAQLGQAIRQLEGRSGIIFRQWREKLKSLMAHFEAGIDFAEEDIESGILDQVRENIDVLIKQISEAMDQGKRGEILRDGYRVVLAGNVNVGKSSLMNAIAKRDAVIVSEEAGTTRDVIEIRMDMNGYPVLIYDTAGLRQTINKIEIEGMRRTNEKIGEADLVVWITDKDEKGMKRTGAESILVRNKIDLIKDYKKKIDVIGVSAKNGEGLDALIDQIENRAINAMQGLEDAVITRTRHRDLMDKCRKALIRSRNKSEDMSDLMAEDIREAAACLGRITGEIGVEEMLDSVFQDFCIGK